MYIFSNKINEHAPYALFFKREAGMKIATYQFINFSL